MLRGMIIYALVAALAGCVTAEELAYERQLELERQQQEARAYSDRLAARCTQFGYTLGERAHSDCMLSLHQQNAATMGAVMQGLAAEQMRQDARRRLYQPTPGYR